MRDLRMSTAEEIWAASQDQEGPQTAEELVAEYEEDCRVIAAHVASCKVDGFCAICQCL